MSIGLRSPIESAPCMAGGPFPWNRGHDGGWLSGRSQSDQVWIDSRVLIRPGSSDESGRFERAPSSYEPIGERSDLER